MVYTSQPWPIYRQSAIDRVTDLICRGKVYDYAGTGPVAELEDAFSALHENHFAVSFNSGTSALFALYGALGINPGDEVLVPNWTFLATASPLLWLGAKPILVDSGRGAPGVTVESLRAQVTDNTRAITVTHVFGDPVDIRSISRFATEHDLLLIEDCSHAHASKVDGRHVGVFGDGAIYSIGSSKMVSGGHGGILVTRHSRVRDLALLIGHFKPRTRLDLLTPEFRRYAEFALGGNLRISPLSAALALDHVGRLDDLTSAKTANVLALDRVFGQVLSRTDLSGEETNGTFFDIVYYLPDGMSPSTRNGLIECLNQAGVPAGSPSTRPLNRVWKGFRVGRPTSTNILLRRLEESASTTNDSDFPFSTSQHDRAISLPSSLLYDEELTYARHLARIAEPILEDFSIKATGLC